MRVQQRDERELGGLRKGQGDGHRCGQGAPGGYGTAAVVRVRLLGDGADPLAGVLHFVGLVGLDHWSAGVGDDLHLLTGERGGDRDFGAVMHLRTPPRPVGVRSAPPPGFGPADGVLTDEAPAAPDPSVKSMVIATALLRASCRGGGPHRCIDVENIPAENQ